MSSRPAMVSIDRAATWKVEVLPGPPMIAPVRQFVLPQAVPGEEDALARGALWLLVQPRDGGSFLAQCALGYAGEGVLHGAFSTPEPDILLAVAGGYAYRINTVDPADSALLPMRPVVSAITVDPADALVLLGFHGIYVLQNGGDWASPRISWEGIVITGFEGEILHGMAWHMRTDRELPFTLNLRTRELSGGAFHP